MPINVQNTVLATVAGIPEQFPKSPLPQIAFSGRSNVGKSSLINTLLGRRALARVSSSPGKTITVNFYCVDNKLFFVDLPGYGFARRSPAERDRLSLLGDRYFASDTVTAVIQLIDMRVGPTADDKMMLEFLEYHKLPYIVAATKSDKLNKTERAKAFDRIPLPRERIIPFSSQNGEGKNELWNYITLQARDTGEKGTL